MRDTPQTKSFTLTDAMQALRLFNDTLSTSKGFGEFTIKWNNGNMTYITKTQGLKP